MEKSLEIETDYETLKLALTNLPTGRTKISQESATWDFSSSIDPFSTYITVEQAPILSGTVWVCQ